MPDKNDLPTCAEGLLKAADAQVAERTEAGEIRQAVVDALADKKVARRTALLDGCVARRKGAAKRLASTTPAAQGYEEDGTEIPGDAFTMNQVESIKALKKEIEEFDAAMETQDFDKMKKLGC